MRFPTPRFNPITLSAVLALASLPLVGCDKGPAASSTVTPQAPADIAMDRKAILAMAGRYDVTFHFEETVALAKGYTKKPIKNTEAQEWVVVIEDRKDFISLQHILIMGDTGSQYVLKHWRQDWRYEPSKVLNFVGGNTWTMQPLSPQVRKGAWSQTVYQVDDTPRYGGVGRWEHGEGFSQWTSAKAWRPLPRRDMTTRSDYHTIDAVQRHVITPFGWAHEQDNTKLVLRGKTHGLTREVGVNSYRTSATLDTASASAKWEASKAYWKIIRDFWSSIEEEHTAFGLTLKGETGALYMPLLTLGDQVAKGEKSAALAAKEGIALVKQYLTFKPAPLQERLRPAG